MAMNRRGLQKFIAKADEVARELWNEPGAVSWGGVDYGELPLRVWPVTAEFGFGADLPKERISFRVARSVAAEPPPDKTVVDWDGRKWEVDKVNRDAGGWLVAAFLKSN